MVVLAVVSSVGSSLCVSVNHHYVTRYFSLNDIYFNIMDHCYGFIAMQ
jgi:pimeloyl-CoA synthetase